MWLKTKNHIEQWLIKVLIKEGTFEAKDIDQDKKEIQLGLYAIKLAFLNSKGKFALSWLVSYYNYILFETKFTITWCDPPEKAANQATEYYMQAVENNEKLKNKNNRP